MNARSFIVDMAVTALAAFVVAAAVTYGYSLVVHGDGWVNWETAFDLALILGVVLPLTRVRGSGKRSSASP